MNVLAEMVTLDVRAWLVWLLAVAVLTMTVRNPLYTLLLLLVTRLVAQVCARPGQGMQLSLWRLGLVILTFSALFNMLFAHTGQTVLFTLPAGWPLVGGPITAEALLYGLISGLALLTLLSAFLAFNQIVPVSDLVRLTPRAFHDLGVVVLIAVTYVPETTQHLRRIQEAQAVRGYRLRGLRDWQPLVIPLLVGGLEKAMGLAEAMVARGYGATAGRQQTNLVRGGLVLGLLLALAGWGVALWWGWPGWLLLAAASGLLLALVWRTGRGAPATVYRPRRWQWPDSALLLLALLPLFLLLPAWPFLAPAGLTYSPYPALALPPFSPLVGALLLLLAVPALLQNSGTREL